MFNISNTADLVSNDTFSNDEDSKILKSSDSFEDNDFQWQNKSITVGIRYNNLQCDDDDWYGFNVSMGELIIVNLWFKHDSGNLKVYIHNQGGGTERWANSWDDDELVYYRAQYTGMYYVKVQYDDNPNYDYDLRVTTLPSTTIFDDDFESGIKPQWSGFGGGNYWHINDSIGQGGSRGLRCGDPSNIFSYDKGSAYEDSIELGTFNFSNYRNLFLEFEYWKNTTSGTPDKSFIYADIMSQNLYLNPQYVIYEAEIEEIDERNPWDYRELDLSVLSGYEDVKLSFVFEADSISDDYSGVFLDNLNFTGFIDPSPPEGTTLGIQAGDEFIYWICQMDSWRYEDILQKPSSVFGDDQDKLKIKIESIADEGPYWKVSALYWEPGTNFESEGVAISLPYRIYKKAINRKAGTDFFIPNNNVAFFNERSDNAKGDWRLKTNHRIDNDDDKMVKYNFDFALNELRVELRYDDNGILQDFNVRSDTWGEIYHFHLEGDHEENRGPEFDPSKLMMSVPGYDLIITISALFAVSLLLVKKVKRNSKN
jgi:hypothetical protein